MGTNKIKGRRGAKLLAASLVFVTFIDDYFHSLAVGAIARPVPIVLKFLVQN